MSENSDALDGTVLVPTHRGAHRLPELLDALVSQDFTGSWEALVVVDGLLDDTEAVLDAYRGRVPLRVLINAVPQGVTSVMNLGIKEARGRIIIRCDDDLLPGTTFVSRHLSHHAGDQLVGIIGPTRDLYSDSAYARAYGRPATLRSLEAAYSRPEAQSWVGWAANNSASREVLLGVGGFDPNFVYGQDSELGYRLHRAGVHIRVDRELEVEHRGPSTAASTRIPRAFISGASKRVFSLKHPETIQVKMPPGGLRDRLWRAAVWSISHAIRTHAGYSRLGKFVDSFLQVAPTSMAARAVALSVESAGASGRRHGVDDLSSYKSQKTKELNRELATASDSSRRNEE